VLRVALTGGIATGKSHVIASFRGRGVPCLDADQLAHATMASGTETTSAIAARFGTGVLAEDGSVDRRKLGPLVFRDAGARRALEAIVHPAVYRAIERELRDLAGAKAERLAIVDVPLLFESGHEGNFDYVVATVCSVEQQRERLAKRGLSDREIDDRLAAQWPAAKKAARADYVISTAGTFEETERAVEATLAALRALADRDW